MSEFTHRFRLSRVLNFALTVAIGLMVLTLIACGGSSASKAANSTPPVTPPVVTVAVAPKSPTLSVNAVQTFTATVTGTSNSAVTWSVAENNGGTIDSAGKYTAAAHAGTYHVVATSQASSTASDSAQVTVTAPAPTFTSSAPTAALEGAVYSYAITATDPTGANDVTFTLTSGPDGATISGSTLTWTPTPGQSRVDDGFTVTANSGAGGINTQSWTVNPNGIIHGSQIDTYWTATGSWTSPNDLSSYTFAAVVKNADGTYTTIPGSGNNDGTFTISGVPAGNYWLTFTDPWGYSNDYWTNSSTYDLGADYFGRDMSAVTCDGTPELDLNLTGLDSVASDSSYLDVIVPNQGGATAGEVEIAAGSPTSYSGPVNTFCPIDPTSGDEAFIVQSEPMTGLATGFEGTYLPGPALSLPGLAAPANTSTPVAGALATGNPQSLDLLFRGDLWSAAFTNVGAGVATPEENNIYVFAQPFVTDRSLSTGLWLQLISVWSDEGLTSNIDGGTVAFNNPYPSSWLQVYSGYAEADISDDYGDWVVNSFATTTAPASGFAPLMSVIQNPSMNGLPLFTSASSGTDAVTLSWTAPSGLAPAGYEINYYCVDYGSCPDNSSGYLYTSSTTVTMRPGLLAVGYDYEFDISAIADSRANYNSSPRRSGFPQAIADVVSAPLTITGAEGEVRRKGAIAKAANAQVARTKYGSFLVTAKGSKPMDIKARMLSRYYQASLKASKAGPVVK